MSEASPAPSEERPSRRRLVWLVGGLVTLLAVAAIWVAYDLRQARSIWPETMPELTMPPPVIAIHPDSLARFDELITASAGLDPLHDARSALLDLEEPPAAPAGGWPADLPEAARALDAWLATGGLALAPVDIEAPPDREYLALIHTAAARRVRALRRFVEGDTPGAWADVTDVWVMGHRIAHAGGHLLAAMIGINIEGGAMTTAQRLLDAGAWDPAAGRLAAELDAAAGHPSPLVAALTGECLSMDGLYLRVGEADVEAVEDGPGDGPIVPAAPGRTRADDTWLYDSDATRAFSRRHCLALIEAAGTPAAQRQMPPAIDLSERRWWSVGHWLDNPIGRILLAIANPAFGKYIDRGDRLLYRERRTRLALARSAFAADRGRAPETLEALIPGFLPAGPLDPFTGQPMALDPPPPPAED